MNLFQRITRGADEALLFKANILGEDGRLSTEGVRAVVDLIFIGKNPSQIREILISEAKAYVQENK